MTDHEKYVLRSNRSFFEKEEEEQFDKMIDIWKSLCESKNGIYFVKYIKHIDNKSSSSCCIFSFSVCFVSSEIIMEHCVSNLKALIENYAREGKKFTEKV